MSEFIYILIGVASALLCLLPARRRSLRGLANMAYLYLAAMVMIYLGAYLVTGDLQRLIIEAAGIGVLTIVAVYFKRNWPYGVALLVLFHGLYDIFLGHNSGVMDWYPTVCAGFDVTAGIGFLLLMKRAQTT